MNALSLLTLVALVAGCAASRPIPTDQSVRLQGKEVYGLVLRMAEGVEADAAKTDACIKQDFLCATIRAEARKFQYATVQLYGSVVFLKVFVPRGAAESGDIIRIKISSKANEAPQYTGIGAKLKDRQGGTCDWINGSPSSFTGGVACKDYSYQSIATGA
jgi:hypothetical protein